MRAARCTHSAGYQRLLTPGHPRADSNGYVYEHILVVERALGHYLRPDAPVHHADEQKSNNAPTNLVACNDDGYHLLLHRRKRAYEACANPNAIRCGYCGAYDRQDEILVYGGSAPSHGTRGMHPDCLKRYQTGPQAAIRRAARHARRQDAGAMERAS